MGSGRAARTGHVDSFDDARGIGTVVDASGTSYPFHCTALTDGTRTVEVGTRVLFELVPTHLGQVEARWISTVTP